MTRPPVVNKTLPNGLTVLIEHLPAVQSAAMTLMFPAGTCHELIGKNGTSALLADLMLRGAGGKNSRELSIALDQLGVHYSLSAGWYHLTLSAATIAKRLPAAMTVLADIVRRPELDRQQFAMCQIGREQVLRSIEDEPRQKVMIELRKRTYASPYNRATEGDLDELTTITLADLQAHYEHCCVPAGAILGIAGNVTADEILPLCEDLFSDWQGILPEIITRLEPGEQSEHLPHDSTQTQIGLAYPSAPISDADYYKAWACVSILSGGMSSRLFTKVREERGLCYAIGASQNSLKDEARVFCYAGTTNERAQETLDVTVDVLRNFGPDLQSDELHRCQARAKSSLIMQEESTMARSSALVRDWFHLGRVTTLDEIRQQVEALTVDSVAEYAIAHRPDELQILTIGPKALKLPG